MKQLVIKIANKQQQQQQNKNNKCEIWGNIVKIEYFVNNCLIENRI